MSQSAPPYSQCVKRQTSNVECLPLDDPYPAALARRADRELRRRLRNRELRRSIFHRNTATS
jgi:hypothetical protein